MKWVDRNLWSIPLFLFLLIVSIQAVVESIWGSPLSLVHLDVKTRQSIYSSLTGSSSSLLGFTIAASAILTAFGKKNGSADVSDQREEALARARAKITVLLLAVSLLLLSLLIISTIGIMVDVGNLGVPLISTFIISSSLASVASLLIAGFGLMLVVIERSRV